MRSGGLHCVWSPPSLPQHDRTTHGRRPHNRILCGHLVCAVVRSAFSITDALRSSVLPLISSAPAKMNYPIMHLQHNSISLVRQYIETSQQCKMETTKIVSSMQLYSQLDKHVSWLAASAINDDRSCRSGREQEIEVGFAASKALNKSCPRCLRRPRHLMSLVLPHGNP